MSSQIGKYLSCSAVASMPFPWFASLHQGGMSYYGCLPFWAKYLSLTRDIFLYLDNLLKCIEYAGRALDGNIKICIVELYDLDIDSDHYEDEIEKIDGLRRAIKETIKEIYSNIESLSGTRISDVSNLIML